ncbi:MAG: lipid IV(A) palmitoyltransferase PagP [Alphaproteobacteria bacterium]|nr:lipid IV(A) palmitoyltransferase PagP [Alphaproteobacteria bacterium]
MRLKTLLLTLIAIVLPLFPVNAGKLAEWTDFVINDIKDMYCVHDYDVYVPVYAWHNRLTYDKEHIDRYNENPWGAGFGISHYNSENTWSGIYAMAFKDSNSYVETYFGYARQWNWTAGSDDQWRAGLGYTLGLTQRHEYAYIPVPLPLPLVGLGYRNFDIQAAYIPGIKNDGNVLFAFTKIHF